MRPIASSKMSTGVSSYTLPVSSGHLSASIPTSCSCGCSVIKVATGCKGVRSDEGSAWGSLDGALAPVPTEVVSLHSLPSSWLFANPPLGESRRSTLRTYSRIEADRWSPFSRNISNSLCLKSCFMSRKTDLPTAREKVTMSSLPLREWDRRTETDYGLVFSSLGSSKRKASWTRFSSLIDSLLPERIQSAQVEASCRTIASFRGAWREDDPAGLWDGGLTGECGGPCWRRQGGLYWMLQDVDLIRAHKTKGMRKAAGGERSWDVPTSCPDVLHRSCNLSDPDNASMDTPSELNLRV